MSRLVALDRLRKSGPLAGPVALRSPCRIARMDGLPARSLPMHLSLMSLAPPASFHQGGQP